MLSTSKTSFTFHKISGAFKPFFLPLLIHISFPQCFPAHNHFIKISTSYHIAVHSSSPIHIIKPDNILFIHKLSSCTSIISRGAFRDSQPVFCPARINVLSPAPGKLLSITSTHAILLQPPVFAPVVCN